MKKIYTLFCLLAFSTASFAQTFTSFTGGSILDPPDVEYFPITVSGLADTIDMTFGVSQVCWNLNHTYDADLDIRLQAPDGTIIELSNNNGGSGDNYTGTCVAENATNGEIGLANAPFTGTFYPDDHLNNVNNGQNPNGDWNLIVLDEQPADTGQFLNWAITFTSYPPPNHAGGPCTTSNAFNCQCPDSSSECDLLPDMINSATYLTSDWSEHYGYIYEGVATPNIGYGPMEVHGTGECYCDTVLVSCGSVCPDGNSPKENVVQTIYHKSGSAMTTYNVSAGTMTYHPSHGHIHVDNWTYNTLRIKGPGPDPSKWPVIGEGSKQSFCLINLGTCDNFSGYCIDQNGDVVAQNQMPNGGLGIVTGCGEDQGIYVGNYDVYSQGLDGQEINFGAICNGIYYIVSITDPDNHITEMNDDNNWAAVLVNLTNQQGNCCGSAFHADTTNGEAPFEVMFIDSTVPIAQSWLWDFGDGFTSTDEFPQHVYTTPGVYNVSLTVETSTGCVDTISKANYITVTGISTHAPDLSSSQDLKLAAYPNPFNSNTTISFHLDAPTYLQLQVKDVVGSTVKVLYDGWHASGNHTITLNENDLANGIYTIRARAGGKEYVLKIVKM